MACARTIQRSLHKYPEKIFNQLRSSNHKGQMGRIAIIGGSEDYTGAPYFAGYSALRVGADLSHIFCVPAAAPVIKSYSADLIVHPILNDLSAGECLAEFCAWTPKFHAFSLGSGLGRELSSNFVHDILLEIKSRNVPAIIDADGIYYLKQNIALFENNRFTLTPNINEFTELYQSVFNRVPEKSTLETEVRLLASTLKTTIVLKGFEDIISDGVSTVTCDWPGSPCRCGGQGDLLSGSMATFTYWACKYSEENATIMGAYSACCLTRHCNRLAFQNLGRSMTTQDMIDAIPHAVRELSNGIDFMT